MLRVPCGLFPAPLAPFDVPLQFEHSWIVRQSLASDFQVSQGSVIIEVSSIQILRACEICFTRVGTQVKSRLDRCFRQSQTRRRVVDRKVVKEVMRMSEQAIRLEKRRITRDSVVQQVGCPEQ